jgi:CRP-like cAMP-binding protein
VACARGFPPAVAIAHSASGQAFELPVDVFLQQLETSKALRQLVLRYALSEHYLSAQSVGCNRFHELSERAARWLLTLQDRTDVTELAITHEFLSQMLGVQRPTVTLALGTLERAGLLERLGRGHLRILDRETLEAAACECYARVRDFNTLDVIQ